MGLTGLDLNTAVQILANNDVTDYKVLYRTSKKGIGTVLDQKSDSNGTLCLYVGTDSIIKNLPSNYQRNKSLENYLMIFQHINNSFDMKMDNIHEIFNPLVTDRKFLFWLSSWFSLELGTDLSEYRYRRLIKDIVTLYHWRGTKHGLASILEVISGYKPDISEGNLESLRDNSDSVDFIFSEAGDDQASVGIHFPVSQQTLGANVVKTIYNIVDKEKPAHISCRITFAPDSTVEKEKFFTIGGVDAIAEDSRL